MSDEITPINGEPKKPGRRSLFSDAQKAELVKGYDAAESKKEFKAEHGISSGQIITWRSALALKAAGHKEPPKAKAARKPREKAEPTTRIITAREVAAYFTALENRVAALERFELRFAKLAGGK